LQKPIGGSINLDNQAITHYQAAHLARKLSLVLTDRVEIGNFSARDLIALGRYPYTGWLGSLTAEDEKIIDWAMQVTETEAFAERNLYELSDGERQKIMIARAAHLDLPNRVMIFQLLHKLAQETDKTILLATHELELALQISNRVWLMSGKEMVYEDIPENLVLKGVLTRLIQQESLHFEPSNGTFSVKIPTYQKIKLVSENQILYFWTSRALARKGWQMDESADWQIAVNQVDTNAIWQFQSPKHQQECGDLAELLNLLENLAPQN
jgi:iron complex transport system ATP-binding protein